MRRRVKLIDSLHLLSQAVLDSCASRSGACCSWFVYYSSKYFLTHNVHGYHFHIRYAYFCDTKTEGVRPFQSWSNTGLLFPQIK